MSEPLKITPVTRQNLDTKLSESSLEYFSGLINPWDDYLIYHAEQGDVLYKGDWSKTVYYDNDDPYYRVTIKNYKRYVTTDTNTSYDEGNSSVITIYSMTDCRGNIDNLTSSIPLYRASDFQSYLLIGVLIFCVIDLTIGRLIRYISHKIGK